MKLKTKESSEEIGLIELLFEEISNINKNVLDMTSSIAKQGANLEDLKEKTNDNKKSIEKINCDLEPIKSEMVKINTLIKIAMAVVTVLGVAAGIFQAILMYKMGK